MGNDPRGMDLTDARLAVVAINRYWQARGFEVNARVGDPVFSARANTTLYPILSDLVNGLPRELAERGMRDG